MNNKPEIAIIGGTIWGNRGAEAMLVTTIGRIRKTHPSAQFFIFSYYPEIDRKLISKKYIHVLSAKPVTLVFQHFFGTLISVILQKIGLSTPKGRFFDCANALDRSDILLDIGGITFSDGREKFLPFNILTILPAMLLGTPVIKLAQAVGPFDHRINRIAASLFLSRCNHIFARGERSRHHLIDLDYPAEKMDVVSDIAFCYTSSFSLSDENNDRVSAQLKRMNAAKQQNKKIIVLSPSVVVNEKLKNKNISYAQIFLNLISQVETSKYHFVFMPNATREGADKKHNNDLTVIEEIRTHIASTGLSTKASIDYIDFDINTSAIRKILSASNILLTSRYHAMISALALCKPTIVIGWGHKYEETMALFDMDAFVIDFLEADKKLTPLVSDLLDREKEISSILENRLIDVQALSEKQFEFLDGLLM